MEFFRQRFMPLMAACGISFGLAMTGCGHEQKKTGSQPAEPQAVPTGRANVEPTPPPAPSSSPSPTQTVTPTPTPTPTVTPKPTPTGGSLRPIPNPVFGVTIDGINPLSDILASLRALVKKPTVRVVFDEWVPATYYQNAVGQIHKVGFVMGELLDSFYVREYSVEQYRKRAQEYVDLLGSKVDIWEIGNEINGEWLGDIPSVVQKMTAAYDVVKAKGGRAALTLYYNEDCWKYPTEEMFAWAQKNVPSRMKTGLDYVWVSYYEDDCNGLQPDWPAVYARLAKIFPNAKIGFGESGTIYQSKKAEYIDRYYNMSISEPQYVGGYFWWYFRQDMVPSTSPLLDVLNDAIR